MRPPATMRRTFVALAGAVLVIAFASMVVPMSGTVSAHTDFDYSLPTDGASVGNPVHEVTVAFTSPVTLIGNGFTALDPQENLIEPFAVTDDDQIFRLQFDPPLAGGAVGVKFEVKAEDGHILSGSFSFFVDAPVPTTAPPTTPPATSPATSAATTTVAPTTTRAATTTDATVPDTPDEADGGTVASDDDGGGGSDTGAILIVAVAIAVGAAGFLLVRSRTSGAA